MRAFGIVAALALVFAAVGFFEYATGRLLITNSKLLEANDVKPYFRVNSVFFDPNIYGRYLALDDDRPGGRAAVVAPAEGGVADRGRPAVLWGGLVLSLSQSSFAALLIGLAVLAGLRWRVAAGARRGRCVAVAASAASSRSRARTSACGRGPTSPSTARRAAAIDLVEGAADDDPRPAGLGLRVGRVPGALPRPRRASAPSASPPSRTRRR